MWYGVCRMWSMQVQVESNSCGELGAVLGMKTTKARLNNLRYHKRLEF